MCKSELQLEHVAQQIFEYLLIWKEKRMVILGGILSIPVLPSSHKLRVVAALTNTRAATFQIGL
jgi:hypothetical protein